MSLFSISFPIIIFRTSSTTVFQLHFPLSGSNYRMSLTTFIIEIVIIARSHRSVRFCVMICQHVSQSVMQVDQLNNTVLFCSNSPLISNSALLARCYFLVLFLPLSATAHWWCVAYWLVDAFRCFSSPFQQQGFGGSGHFGAFTLSHITLKIV